MDNFVELYTSREGRISRKSFWIGILILAAVNIVISFLLLPMIGVSLMPNIAALSNPAALDGAAVSKLIADSMRSAGWASLVLFAIFAYPAYALLLKRRHDRNNNGLDVLVYMVLTALMLLLQALGIGYDMVAIGEMTVPMPSMLISGLGFILGVYALYLLVVCGFLKGTEGPNQYGPDPLGRTAAATA